MNNLNKIILIIALLGTSLFYGQKKQDREKIKSLKIAYITEKLDLTSKEAEAFWPVYNGHEKKLQELRKKERSQGRNRSVEINLLSEKEAADLLNAQLELEQLKDDEKIGFIQEVRTIISAKKTLLLIEAEEEFKRKLIRQYRKKRGGGGNR